MQQPKPVDMLKRRLLSGVSLGVMALGFPGRGMAAELEACKSGKTKKNDWKASWDSNNFYVNNTRPAKLTSSVLNLSFYSKKKKDKYELLTENQVLNLYIASSKKPGKILRLYFTHDLIYFATPQNTYWPNISHDPKISGMYKTALSNKKSTSAQVKISLKRKNMSPISALSTTKGVEFHLTKKQAASALNSKIKTPFFIDFEVDGKLFLRREYNVTGLITLLNEVMKKHYTERQREAKKQCRNDCFLTTSTCSFVGLADDCWELQTLRKFRDDFMMQRDATKKEVKQYYKIAPEIIHSINKKSDHNKIYLKLYWLFILPCAFLAKLKLNKLVRNHYLRMLRWLC